jgi:hypothetical protein
MDPGPLSRRAIFTLVSLLALTAVSLREYSRFTRGDSIANLLLPADASRTTLIIAFVVAPVLVSITSGILIARAVEKE